MTDGSLGPAGAVPQVGGDFQITDDLGAYSRSGRNLFHSFSRFDVAGGESATFSAAQGAPHNVVARVTGDDGSTIAGTVRSTIPGANLFLLDPTGVMFTEGASLDVQGSFYASSAGVLRFGDGVDFDTASRTPLPADFTCADLPCGDPTGFGFLPGDEAQVSLTRPEDFSVPAGRTLSLVGAMIRLLGGDSPNVIDSPGANVQLVAAQSGFDVPLDAGAIDAPALAPGSLGEVRAEGGSGIVVSSPGADVPAGSIVIRGEQFVMGDSTFDAFHASDAGDALGGIDISVVDSALLVRSTLRTRTTAGGRSGDVRIRAGGTATLSGTVLQTGANIASDVDPGVPDSGDIVLEASKLFFTEGSQLQGIAGGAESGTLVLDADTIEISGGGTAIFTRSIGNGASGTIGIFGDEVRIEGQAEIATQALSSGSSGSVRIEADDLRVRGATLASEATRNGISGDVRLIGTSLVVGSTEPMTSPTAITSTSTADGTSGALDLTGDQLVVQGDATIASDAAAAGASGPISLSGADLAVMDGARLVSTTAAGADGADIALSGDRITVSNTAASPRGTTVTAQTLVGSTGTGGTLRIEGGRLELTDGGNVLVATRGSGATGALEVDVDTAVLRGADPGDADLRSGLFSQASEGSSGDAGRLRIGARMLEVDDGAQISAISFGSGAAGDIVIGSETARLERFTLRGGPIGASEVNAEAVVGDGGAIGASGDITIDADRFELLDGGQVSTLSQGAGDAGDLLVRTAELVIAGVQDPVTGANESGLFSTVPQNGGSPTSTGGNVTVEADRFVLIQDGGQISTTTRGLRTGGDIAVGAPEIDIAGVNPGPVGRPSGVFSNSEGAFGIADAGRITVDAKRRLSLRNGGRIATETVTPGNAGQIVVKGGDLIQLIDGASISASSRTETVQPGDAGTIDVSDTTHLELVDSRIETSATQSSGGQISIETRETIELRGSTIASEVRFGRTDEDRGGGDVAIETRESLYLFESEITTSVLNDDQPGGSVEVDPELVVLNTSFIRADADEDYGGFVRITADQYLQSLSSAVTATSANPELSGTVVIDSPDSTVTGDLTPLPERFLDVTALVTNVCAARTARAGSFVVDDRNALPPPPDALLPPRAATRRDAAPPCGDALTP